MNGALSLGTVFPPIRPLQVSETTGSLTYIGGAGLEDRALAILKEAKRSGIGSALGRIIAIEYRPWDRRNKKREFEKVLSEMGVPKDNVKWIVYDRYHPSRFLDSFDEIRETCLAMSKVLVDISAMPKLLIVVLLQGLRDLDLPLIIGYGEGEAYNPKEQEYNAKKGSLPEATPDFLTSDVYKIMTTNSISSVAMQGYPLMMVAFSTFNHRELVALINEITPQYFIVLDGRPHEDHNAWRLEAIRWINRKVRQEALEALEVDTFNYIESVVTLEKLYQEYQYTHKFVVAPTGSKFQTLGVFFFKQMHPDAQIIYPITKRFVSSEAEGCKALWEITFPRFSSFLEGISGYRKQSLVALREVIRQSELS